MACTDKIIPVVVIDSHKFILHKHTTNTSPASKCILEVSDTLDGSVPGGHLFGTYLGGDEADFSNPQVYDNWGGSIEE